MVQAGSTHIIQNFQLAFSDLLIATLKSMNWVCFFFTFMFKGNKKCEGRTTLSEWHFCSKKAHTDCTFAFDLEVGIKKSVLYTAGKLCGMK